MSKLSCQTHRIAIDSGCESSAAQDRRCLRRISLLINSEVPNRSWMRALHCFANLNRPFVPGCRLISWEYRPAEDAGHPGFDRSSVALRIRTDLSIVQSDEVIERLTLSETGLKSCQRVSDLYIRQRDGRHSCLRRSQGASGFPNADIPDEHLGRAPAGRRSSIRGWLEYRAPLY